MKIGPLALSGRSLVLLAVQLALVGSIAGKYLYQRWTCPRVWTKTVAYDPELLMRGRYLSLLLTVDGCGSTLPSAKNAQFPRNADGTVQSPKFAVSGAEMLQFQANLAVKQNHLVAEKLPVADEGRSGQWVSAGPGSPCEQMRLTAPVNFYIGEHAGDALPGKAGDELWIEVTVPPKGPPRPVQLALKRGGRWTPLAVQ